MLPKFKMFYGLMLTLVLSGWGLRVDAVDVDTVEIKYEFGPSFLKGYLAYSEDLKDQRPGVLVVHEWWGHNDYARKRAKQIAELGYVALAIDMYGEGKQADHPDQAGAFATEVMSNAKLAKGRFEAALDILKAHPRVDRNKIAAIGYCFGGSTVLAMAEWGLPLKGVVSFHGGLEYPVPEQPKPIVAKMLVCHGADDKMITSEQISVFKDRMKAQSVDMTFKSYPNSAHSFTNPKADQLAKKFELPLAYNETADKASWADMKAFLDSIFHDNKKQP